MKTLYIHIGTMKTGSTAIQLFLWNHKEYLEKNSFIFPKSVYSYPGKPKRRNAAFLATAAISSEINDDSFDRSIIDKEIAMLEKCFSERDNVILSEETAWHQITSKRRMVWEKTIKHFQNLGITVKVIVYLRRQDLFIESYWKESIKHNRGRWSLKECIEKRKEKIKVDYLSNMDDIAQYIGKENIIVRRYQREDLIEGDVVIDFLTILGLPVNEVRDEILNKEAVNTSYANNAAGIARELNNVPNLTIEQSRRLVRSLRAVSEIENKRTVQYSMFSAEEAKALVNQYRKSNDKLAKKYISDGKPLFNDTYKNGEKWHRDNPYFMIDILHFIGSSTNELLDKIEEQDRRIKELEKNNFWSIIKKIIRKVKSK